MSRRTTLALKLMTDEIIVLTLPDGTTIRCTRGTDRDKIAFDLPEEVKVHRAQVPNLFDLVPPEATAGNASAAVRPRHPRPARRRPRPHARPGRPPASPQRSPTCPPGRPRAPRPCSFVHRRRRLRRLSRRRPPRLPALRRLRRLAPP
jgi:hypothetical protein